MSVSVSVSLSLSPLSLRTTERSSRAWRDLQTSTESEYHRVDRQGVSPMVDVGGKGAISLWKRGRGERDWEIDGEGGRGG